MIRSSILIILLQFTLTGHEPQLSFDTCEFTAPGTITGKNVLHLSIKDGSGKFTAARFTITVDGRTFVPDRLSKEGIRFTSKHRARRQNFTVTYGRGTGVIKLKLPDASAKVAVTAVKGFEYLPVSVSGKVERKTQITINLKKWSRIKEKGWLSMDEHIHFDRLDPKRDSDWLKMLEADGLSYAHFMVLKGVNMKGVWAKQYHFGPHESATDGSRFLIPGQEFRDGFQGHFNLLGINRKIEPMTTGSKKCDPPHPFNFPPSNHILTEARNNKGLAGVAHGMGFGNEMALCDTVLGKVDFYEIANTFLQTPGFWYTLLNCGYSIPPVGGTDLPNYPTRESWQPFLGEVRTYIQCSDKPGFDSWKNAVKKSRTFVTNGPLLEFSVNGKSQGTTIDLETAGTVRISAKAMSSKQLKSLVVVKMGKALDLEFRSLTDKDINVLELDKELKIEKSCWLAVVARGEKMKFKRGLRQMEVWAHSSPVRIIVDKKPIRLPWAVKMIKKKLEEQKKFYLENAKYQHKEDAAAVQQLFEEAIKAIGK